MLPPDTISKEFKSNPKSFFRFQKKKPLNISLSHRPFFLDLPARSSNGSDTLLAFNAIHGPTLNLTNTHTLSLSLSLCLLFKQYGLGEPEQASISTQQQQPHNKSLTHMPFFNCKLSFTLLYYLIHFQISRPGFHSLCHL